IIAIIFRRILERTIIVRILKGHIGSKRGPFRCRKDAQKPRRLITAAHHGETRLLSIAFGDDVDSARSGEITEMREIRTFEDLYPVDGFRNEPVEVSVSLAMGIAGHVHRNAVDRNLKVGSVIVIETAKQDLVCLAAAMVLPDDQTWHQSHHVARGAWRTKLQILRPSGLLGRRRRRLLSPRVNFNRISFGATGDQRVSQSDHKDENTQNFHYENV